MAERPTHVGVIRAALLMSALAACVSTSGPTDDVAIVVPDEPRALVEPLDAQVVQARATRIVPLGSVQGFAAIEPTLHVQTSPDGLASLVDEHREESLELASAEDLAGARFDASTLLLSLDGELAVHGSDGLRETPLAEAVPFPVERLEAGAYAHWLGGAGRLLRLAQGRLTELRVSEKNVLDWAPSPSGQVWMATPQLVGLDALSPDLDLVDFLDEPVRDVTVDERGWVWAIDDAGQLLARHPTDGWVRFLLPSPALELAGHPRSPHVWIRTEDGALVHEASRFAPVQVPEGTWADTDAIGRLIVLDGDQAQRVSLGFPTAFSGLAPGAAVQTRIEVGLVPTEGEATLTAWVDDTPLGIDTAPHRVELDPDRYAEGEHLLRVVARSTDGVHTSGLPFRIGDLPEASWEGDIAELSSERCSGCHGGASLTVLQTKEQWRARIDTIIDQVSDEAMPLGGPPLSADDIARIRGWKQGGFP